MSNPVGPKAAERGECSKRAKKADRRRHFARPLPLSLSLSLSIFRRSSFYDLDRSELAVVVGFQSGSARGGGGGGSAAVMAVPVELDNSAGVSC